MLSDLMAWLSTASVSLPSVAIRRQPQLCSSRAHAAPTQRTPAHIMRWPSAAVALISLSVAAGLPASSDFIDYNGVRIEERWTDNYPHLDVLPEHYFYTDDKIYTNQRYVRSAPDSAGSLGVVLPPYIVRRFADGRVGSSPVHRLTHILALRHPAKGPVIGRPLYPATDSEDGETPPFILEHPAFGVLQISAFEHGLSDVLAAPAPARPYPVLFYPSPAPAAPRPVSVAPAAPHRDSSF